MEVDLLVRNGIVVTASDIWPACDIAIKVPQDSRAGRDNKLTFAGRNDHRSRRESAGQRWQRNSGR